MVAPIPRPAYDAILKETLETPSIKVLTGIRRCGKSTLLKMLCDSLRQSGIPDENILYLRLDSYEAPLEPTAQWLDELLSSSLSKSTGDHPFYAFLDEVQEVPEWERPIRRLHSDGRARIYLTGSTAFLLSSDLATFLSGRYTDIPVYPLSFSEYLAFSTHREQREETEPSPAHGDQFIDYLRFGGMPGIFSVDRDEGSIARELSAIRDTVLLNDVAKRFNIRDIDLLEKLLRYMLSTSGNLFSGNKVAGALTSMGRKTNPETIDNYLNALRRAFVLYRCEQTGLKGKKVLQPQGKFYGADTGLRSLANGFKMQDVGFQLENVVFMELLRRGYDVHVGALPSGEIDFVADRRGERLYVQVCETLIDDVTRERETASLEAVRDSHPKIILTRDPLATGITESGIRIQLVTDWLLES